MLVFVYFDLNFLVVIAQLFLSFQNCLVMCTVSDEATNMVVYQAIMRGLERLLIAKVLNAPDTEMLTKLSVDRWVGKPYGVHVIPMWGPCDTHVMKPQTWLCTKL